MQQSILTYYSKPKFWPYSNKRQQVYNSGNLFMQVVVVVASEDEGSLSSFLPNSSVLRISCCTDGGITHCSVASIDDGTV